MKTVNLSSRPFTNHRLFWAALVAIWIVCGLIAWSLSEQKMVELAEIGRTDAAIKANKLMQDKLQEDNRARLEDQSKIFLTDQDRMYLAAARQLIARRAFSWDKMTTDLEENVPNETKIVSVKVAGIDFSSNGPVVTLDIAALGPDPAQLTEMMTRLEKSNGLFTVGEVAQAQIGDNGQVPFNMTVQYRPARGAD